MVVTVEETAGEAVGTERGFYQHDTLQYASAPVWTEKLRRRLAKRLGDNIWYGVCVDRLVVTSRQVDCSDSTTRTRFTWNVRC